VKIKIQATVNRIHLFRTEYDEQHSCNSRLPSPIIAVVILHIDQNYH